MGLGKFDGDDKLLSKEELERMFNAVELVNRESQSVAFVIVHDTQIKVVKDLLRQFGYQVFNTMVIYKQYKNDKVRSGGFISAAVFAVVAFKDITVMQRIVWPMDADNETRTKWMQNVWTVVNATKPYLDAEGQPVNSCPQDPMIVERLVHMFRGFFGERFTIFSSGEGSGWASLVAMRLNANAVITESSDYSYFYLIQRLMSESGLMKLTDENQKKFWKHVLAYWSTYSKENAIEQERLKYLVSVLSKSTSLNGLDQHAINQVLQTMSSNVKDLRTIAPNDLVEKALVHVKTLKRAAPA